MAPFLIIPACSCSMPGKNPGTSTSVIMGMLNASQNRTHRDALTDALMSSTPEDASGWFATIETVLPSILANPVMILDAKSGASSKKLFSSTV